MWQSNSENKKEFSIFLSQNMLLGQTEQVPITNDSTGKKNEYL